LINLAVRGRHGSARNSSSKLLSIRLVPQLVGPHKVRSTPYIDHGSIAQHSGASVGPGVQTKDPAQNDARLLCCGSRPHPHSWRASPAAVTPPASLTSSRATGYIESYPGTQHHGCTLVGGPSHLLRTGCPPNQKRVGPTFLYEVTSCFRTYFVDTTVDTQGGGLESRIATDVRVAYLDPPQECGCWLRPVPAIISHDSRRRPIHLRLATAEAR
jgi:hypothetical protein